MATYISRSPDETAALGEQWGREAQSGLVIGLSGELGAGKTQLVKGLARGLNITERVHSPTFALINIYEGGRLPLFHLDLYRLDMPEQIVAAGLEQYLHPKGVTVIEWVERWFSVTPLHAPVLRSAPAEERIRNTQYAIRLPMTWVTFEELSKMERRITYENIGA